MDEPVDMGLETELRRAILSGKRRRNLKNISIKVVPLQVIGISAFQNQAHRRAAEVAEGDSLLIQSGLRCAVAALSAQAGDPPLKDSKENRYLPDSP